MKTFIKCFCRYSQRKWETRNALRGLEQDCKITLDIELDKIARKDRPRTCQLGFLCRLNILKGKYYDKNIKMVRKQIYSG